MFVSANEASGSWTAAESGNNRVGSFSGCDDTGSLEFPQHCGPDHRHAPEQQSCTGCRVTHCNTFVNAPKMFVFDTFSSLLCPHCRGVTNVVLCCCIALIFWSLLVLPSLLSLTLNLRISSDPVKAAVRFLASLFSPRSLWRPATTPAPPVRGEQLAFLWMHICENTPLHRHTYTLCVSRNVFELFF